MDTDLGQLVQHSSASKRVARRTPCVGHRSRVLVLLALSILLGLCVGVSNGYRHWLGGVDDTGRACTEALSLLKSVTETHTHAVPTALEAVALGANLDVLSYHVGDRSWQVGGSTLYDPAADHAHANPGHRIVVGDRLTGGELVTVVPAFHVMHLDVSVAVGVAAVGFLMLLLGPGGVTTRLAHAEAQTAAAAPTRPWRRRVVALSQPVAATVARDRAAETPDAEQAWDALRLRELHANLLHDTAERVRRSERLQTMKQLVEKFSHEIRNPLASMQATLSCMRFVADKDPLQQRRMRDRLERNIAQMVCAVGELQAFGDAYQHCDEQLDLAVRLRALEQDVPTMPRVSVRTASVVNCAVHVDVERFDSAMRKLLDNALLAIEERQGLEPALRGDIVLQAWRRGQRVVIAVDDNGVGICERARERLFEPFFTTRPNGFGLGLAIVKQFADHYGGSLRAVNMRIGSRIELELPCSVSTDEAHQAPVRESVV